MDGKKMDRANSASANLVAAISGVSVIKTVNRVTRTVIA